MLLQAAEVHGVEHVAVEDELVRADSSVDDILEKRGEFQGLAVWTAEVEVGENNRVCVKPGRLDAVRLRSDAPCGHVIGRCAFSVCRTYQRLFFERLQNLQLCC